MIKQLLVGGAAVMFITGTASALTMNVSSDSRSIDAFAQAGGDTDSGSDSASGGVFDSSVNASASADVVFLSTLGSGGGAGGLGFGAVANSSASQFSEVDAATFTISASGFAEASGNHGDFRGTLTSEEDGSGGGGGLFFGDFRADASSYMEVYFSIDADAKFDISGFLSAGNEIAVGDIETDVINEASIILVNTDTNESAFKTSVSNGSVALEEMGVIGAGNYRFMVEASADVNGLVEDELVSSINGGDNGFGYATSAGFKGVSLSLDAVDQPIPEPVTTTLAAMGLGALVLRTSRRRHS